jgi:hypothetical protein
MQAGAPTSGMTTPRGSVPAVPLPVSRASLVAIAVVLAWAVVGLVARSPQQPPAQVPSGSRSALSGFEGDSALSDRNANYSIEARLDHGARTLTGVAVVHWRNTGRAATDSLRLHLYWNAWRNAESTWMREEWLPGRPSTEPQAEDWSAIDISSLTIVNADGTAGADLLPGLTFVQPDDGNVRDRSLASVVLPSPVAAGDEIAIRVGWTSRVPRTFARTGAIADYYFIAHWFPKIAVFADGRWVAHQFHANTEFFSDYGTYDVRLTVPHGWIVGATGTERSRTDNADGTTTHRYVQHDVHDFAWTTSPHYVEVRRRFEHPRLPGVEMRLLLQPEHRGQQDRHFAATAAALRYYGEWYGPYPYGHITVVDPAYQSGAGGMEYPTLFTAGTRWLAPRQSNSPEAVTVHEAGHQFWYGVVGNNEFEDAWLDEGLNTFSEERVQSIAFQPNYRVERFFGGFIPWQLRDVPLSRATDGNGLNGYRAAAESDVPSMPTFRYWPGTHAQITYSKTALWLHTLERMLGWDTLQRILSTFFNRWQFRHPRPGDFFAVANEISGQDLTWFFDQVYRSSNVFDYGVERFASERLAVPGVADREPRQSAAAAPTTYRTTVVVRRYGEAVFPVDVLTTFEDGEAVRERWEGQERWRSFSYDRASRAASVQVDPDRVLLLDIDYTNNSRSLAPQADVAARKWSLVWMIWLQDLLLTWAFFA